MNSNKISNNIIVDLLFTVTWAAAKNFMLICKRNKLFIILMNSNKISNTIVVGLRPKTLYANVAVPSLPVRILSQWSLAPSVKFVD